MSLIQIEKLQATGRQYWRSLNELAGTSEFRSWVEQEFPGGTELLEGESRRNVLKLMAASFGLAGLAACRRPVERIVPQAKGVEDLIPGKPLLYNTAFVQNGEVLGVVAEAHDGRPTKLEGMAGHPNSLGAATAYAQASILGVYDPDRSREVWRAGKAAKWEDWDAFAAGHFTPAKLGDGASLAIVSGRTASAALRAQVAAIQAKYPKARWVEYEAFGYDYAARAIEQVFGRPLEAQYRFDRADVVVSLDADFLSATEMPPAAVKQFSAKRRVEKPDDPMSRLYSIESRFTITGAMADHRVRVRPSEVDGAATLLARELGALAELNIFAPGDAAQKVLMAMVRDLKAHPGKSLVVAGPHQSLRVHLLALMINAVLGNIGQTVTFTEPVARQTGATLADLVRDLNGGLIQTVVLLETNPVFTAPADLDVAGALKRAAVSVHLGLERDETAAAAQWHLPAAHFLEAWGDAVAADGTLTIQQPLILPMNGGRSSLEVAAQISSGSMAKGYELVRRTVESQYFSVPAAKAGGADSEKAWRQALHDGVLRTRPAAEVKVSADPKKVSLPAPAPKPAGLEVVFSPSPAVYDGRYANNAWLQEMPGPMTKLVWDNAALISPATARKLGLNDGDLVTLTRNGKSVEIPAMRQPGLADDTVAVELGYGRKETGRVGRGVGFNAYAIRTQDALGFGRVDLAKTGKTYPLVTTQEHHTMIEPETGKSRPIVREGSLGEYREHPEFAKHMVHAPDESIYGWWDYSKGYQWGMAIDLSACTGCNACVIACQSENNIPVVGKEQVSRGREMHWIRLDRYYTGSEDEATAVVQPLNCQQCENAPCESVCPVAATVHSPEGLNDMVYNRCVGTRYCANNCPYKVRRFNYLNYHKEMTEVEKMVSNPDVTVRMRGVMEKCTYCVQRIQEKKIQAKLEGRRAIRDGEVQTACQQTCPADAIVFGNINDPDSRVSKLKKQPRDYALLAEVNTRPRTTYLAKIRNLNPELGGAPHGAASKEHHG